MLKPMEPHLIVKVFFSGGLNPTFEAFAYSPDENRALSDEAIEWAIEQAVLKHPHATHVRVYEPITQAEVSTHTEVEIVREDAEG